VKLTVIVVNYNVKHFLEQCLFSVRNANKSIDMEVFVVDNNSVDGSVDLVKSKFPEVKLIENKENLGFSKANNQAMRLAQGEFVLLLNPDTVVQENTFMRILEFMDEHPDAGGLGVKMIDGKGKFLPESKRGLPSPSVAFYKMLGLAKLFPKSRVFGAYHLGFLDREEISSVDVLSGAFMLLRQSVLQKVGLLDETFFMYGEDVDLSYRITQAGYKNYYYPKTTIIHYKGESTKKSSVNYVFVFYKAMAIFAEKHFTKEQAGLFGMLIRMAIWLRAGVALCYRFWLKFSLPLLDFVMLFVSMFLLKNYWELEVMHNSSYYPPDFMLVNAPLYALLWIGGVWLTKGYEHRPSIFRVARGVLIGTIAISVAYAFINEEYRFSRALIILGTLAAMLAISFNRVLIHFIKYRNFNLGIGSIKNTIIVGNKAEADRVWALLNKTTAPSQVLGIVTTNQTSNKDENWLGDIEQLNEIVDFFKVNEVIFCSKDIRAKEIIGIMASTHSKRLEFKIVPEESLYIIGSNHKDSAGDFYTIDISLDISKPANKAVKRAFDILASIFLLALTPVLGLLNGNPVVYVKNLVKVLIGRYTLVGYAHCEHQGILPKMKPGILNPTIGFSNLKPGVHTQYKLNLLYAKDYSIERDLSILLNGLTKLAQG
jgi:GT2 family glycosyltransferase